MTQSTPTKLEAIPSEPSQQVDEQGQPLTAAARPLIQKGDAINPTLIANLNNATELTQLKRNKFETIALQSGIS